MDLSRSNEKRVPYVINNDPSTTPFEIVSTLIDIQNSTDSVKKYWDIISLRWVRIIIMAVTMLAVVIAIAGNILVIIIIYRRRSLRRNPTILFILNLALCDIISCLIYRPLFLTEMFLPFTSHFEEFVNHLHKCKVASYFKSLFAAVGFHIIVAISQERLLLIVYPLKAKIICTVSRTAKILAIIWILAILLVLPIPLKYTEIISFDVNGIVINFCGYFSGARHAIIYHSLMFAFYFAIPLILLTVSYIKIFRVLYQRQSGLDVNTEAGGGKSMRIRRNLAKMMVSVSLIFALCWGPHFIFFLHIACGGKVPKNGFFTATVVEFLPIISSIMNPLLYTLNSRTFRSGFKAILFRTRPSEEPSGARSFANPDSITKTTSVRRSTLLGFSSFRLGGSKADKSVKFRSPDNPATQRLNHNGATSASGSRSRTGSFTDETTALSQVNKERYSRRDAFNNNKFEVTQATNGKSNQETSLLRETIPEEMNSGGSSGSASSHNNAKITGYIKEESV